MASLSSGKFQDITPRLKSSLMDIPNETLFRILSNLLDQNKNITSFAVDILQVCRRFCDLGGKILYHNLHFRLSEKEDLRRFLSFNPSDFRDTHPVKSAKVELIFEPRRFDINLIKKHLEKHFAPSNVLSCVTLLEDDWGPLGMFNLPSIVESLPNSIRDLGILIGPFVQTRSTRFLSKLSEIMKHLRRLHLRLPSFNPAEEIPLNVHETCPELEEIVVAFSEDHNDSRAVSDTADLAQKIYEALVGANLSGFLPNLQKGLVLHTVPERMLVSKPLALFHSYISAYDIIRMERTILPTLMIDDDSSDEGDYESIMFDQVWTQFFVSRERREEHPTEFIHYHDLAASRGGYAVSVVASLDHIPHIIAGSSWPTGTYYGDFGHKGFNYPRPPNDIDFDEEYYQRLFSADIARGTNPQILEFVLDHVRGRCEPVAIPNAPFFVTS